MDYKGLYSDLAWMHRQALSAALNADLTGDEELSRRIDNFAFEVSDFMDEVVLRRW